MKTVHLSKTEKIKATAEFDQPINAPVQAGQKIGTLKIEIDGQNPLEIPLVADKNVSKVGLLGRLWFNVKYFVFGAK